MTVPIICAAKVKVSVVVIIKKEPWIIHSAQVVVYNQDRFLKLRTEKSPQFE